MNYVQWADRNAGRRDGMWVEAYFCLAFLHTFLAKKKYEPPGLRANVELKIMLQLPQLFCKILKVGARRSDQGEGINE